VEALAHLGGVVGPTGARVTEDKVVIALKGGALEVVLERRGGDVTQWPRPAERAASRKIRLVIVTVDRLVHVEIVWASRLRVRLAKGVWVAQAIRAAVSYSTGHVPQFVACEFTLASVPQIVALGVEPDIRAATNPDRS